MTQNGISPLLTVPRFSVIPTTCTPVGLGLPAGSAVNEAPCEVGFAVRLRGVHDPSKTLSEVEGRLDRMQLQSGLRRPTLHLFQRRASFRLAAAKIHEVVCVPHHLEARRLPPTLPVAHLTVRGSGGSLEPEQTYVE